MKIGYGGAADPGRFAAVILAAGLSSRMKDFKPLLPVDGRPAVTGLVESLRGAGVSDIIVVTGYNRELLQEELERLRVEEAYNEGYERGMFSSIQTGLAKATELFPDREGYFLVPVDCPLITIRTLRALMDASAESAGGPAFFVPVYEGKKGHPLLVPREFVGEIIEYEGTGGLKAITDAHWEQMHRVSVPDEECLLDMDTPEGYEEIQSFVAHGFKREKLSVLSSRKRIILVRHGETRQHDEPMFIGQYDVPLSEEGQKQAGRLAEQIADMIGGDVAAQTGWIEGISLGREPLPAIEAVYCSDLDRAKETAEVIREKINSTYAGKGIYAQLRVIEGLREIDLGDWDGRPIREIREQYPDLYERRGKDLFTFKTGNRGENFYDMQYRSIRALKDILADDYARNIIIVAHSGVIRALENNLRGMRIDDPWETLPKGELRVWQEERK